MTRVFHALLAAATLVSLGSGGRAAAQDRSRPGAGSVLDIAIGERAAASRIRAQARSRLLDALDGDRDVALGPAPDVLLEQAIARYDTLIQLFPDDVDAWLERALSLAEFCRVVADGREESRIDEAITAYEHARALDANRETAFVAFQLAVLQTRRGEYALAAAEYQRAADARELYPSMPLFFTRRELGMIVLFLPQSIETTLANWAEVTMLSGDATNAADRYREALTRAPVASDSAALALWGLALAQERAGSHADAMETALRAIDGDHSADHPMRSRVVDRYGAFAVLHLDGVFFEPACEIHAYESLGHEALATRASTPEGRTAEWTAARLSARFFLAEGGRSSPYASVATDAEARLTRLLTQ